MAFMEYIPDEARQKNQLRLMTCFCLSISHSIAQQSLRPIDFFYCYTLLVYSWTVAAREQQ